MNVLVDSSAWIEYFAGGKLVEKCSKYIEKANKKEYFTPTVVLYEVYKKLKKEVSEEVALSACAHIMGHTTIVNLNDEVAFKAGDISLSSNLGMADSIIVATALLKNAKIVTMDKHLKGLGNVMFIE